MISRRSLLRSAGMVGGTAAFGPALAACMADDHGRGGPPAGGTNVMSPVGYVAANRKRTAGSDAAAATAARAVAALGVDLYSRLVTEDQNLVISPWSVMVALAMTRAGAVGRTATEMDSVLHGTDLGDGMSWLDQSLHGRTGERPNASGKNGPVGLETANSLWGQAGITWLPAFLEDLAGDFGAGMHTVDYKTDATGACRQINDWTAERTHDRITDLIPDGALDAMTRLVLVNAIWFKAPWFEAFEPENTRPQPFRRSDGSTVDVPMMTNLSPAYEFAQGPDWRAASLPYAGNELAMAVVVPQGEATLATLEDQLGDGGLNRLLASFERTAGTDVLLPKWQFRTRAALMDVLIDLGMPTAFTDAADFSAMTRDEDLQVEDVLHEGFVAVDEHGTEAAAATAVMVRAVSAQLAQEPYVVHADRPFVFVVYDVATRLPLFLGRVTDPTA
jgi:serpin B